MATYDHAAAVANCLARRNSLGPRLATIAAKRLGIDVTFLRWIEQPTGDVPVFRVPSSAVAAAREAGLTVES